MEDFTNEQKEAVLYDGGNMIVSAAAGSGKTRVMIERVLNIVCNKKAKVSEILALTFTKNSASEMKERLKSAVLKRINEGDTDLIEEYNSVQTADFSTFDSFSYNLSKRYFYVVGISPDFSVIDSLKEQTLKMESINQTFKEFFEENDGEFLKLIERFRVRRRDDNLKDIILKIHEKLSAYENPSEVLDRYKSLYTEESYDRILKEFEKDVISEFTKYKEEAEDILYQSKNSDYIDGEERIKYIIDKIDVVLESGIYGINKILDFNVNFNKGKRASSGVQELLKKRSMKLRDSIVKSISEFAGYIPSREEDFKTGKELLRQTEILVKVINRFIDIYDRNKERENVLDFADLERRAITILSDEAIRNEIRNKYKYVFVDEYQDVNKVQEKMIELLSKDNLFVVGDVKQSIYGFRGIQSIFNERIDSMKEKGEKAIFLNKNFRSSKKVIDMVNSVFLYCMNKNNSGVDYSQNMLAEGGVYPKEFEGRSNLYIVEKTQRAVSEKTPYVVYDLLKDAYKKKTKSISNVALQISKIIEEERHKKFYDIKEKRERYIEYSDIAVLSRVNENVYIKGIVDILTEQNIPVSSNVKQSICDFPEVKLLINVLKLIDNFNSDIPLVTVLKSPIGNFSEEELVEISNFSESKEVLKKTFSGRFSDYICSGSGATFEKAKSFYEYFGKIRYLADFMGAGEILKKIINDCDYESYFLTYADGENKLLRIKRFIELSNSDKGALSVREYLNVINLSKDKFYLNLSAGENAVKVVTIHSSKGLEYPVVIVCGIDKKFNEKDENKTVIFDDEFGLCNRYFDDENRRIKETIYRWFIKKKMHEATVKEEMRVFYVALTRAKYALHIVSGDGADNRNDVFNDADCFMDFVPSSIPAVNVNKEDLAFVGLTKPTRKVIIGKNDDNVSRKLSERFNYKYPFIDDTTLKLKTNVSEIVKNLEGYLESPWKFSAEDKDKISMDKTDTDRGVLAHAIMEHFDYQSQDGLETQVKKMAEGGLFSKEQLSTLSLSGIEKALVKIREIVNGYSIYREKSFLLNVSPEEVGLKGKEKVLIQGIVDLLAISGNEAILIDYKYSAKGKEKLKESYKKQIELYSLAIGKILNRKVTEKYLVNILTGEIVSMD